MSDTAKWLVGALLDKLASDDTRRDAYFKIVDRAARDCTWIDGERKKAEEITIWHHGEETRIDRSEAVMILVKFAELALPYFRSVSMNGQLPALAELYRRFGKVKPKSSAAGARNGD